MTDQTKATITLPPAPFEYGSSVEFKDISEILLKNQEDEAVRQQMVAAKGMNKDF